MQEVVILVEIVQIATQLLPTLEYLKKLCKNTQV